MRATLLLALFSSEGRQAGLYLVPRETAIKCRHSQKSSASVVFSRPLTLVCYGKMYHYKRIFGDHFLLARPCSLESGHGLICTTRDAKLIQTKSARTSKNDRCSNTMRIHGGPCYSIIARGTLHTIAHVIICAQFHALQP